MTSWPESVAAVSALVLLCLLLPVGDIISVRRHPLHALGVYVVSGSLTLLVIAPGVPHLPPATWPSAAVLAVAAVAAVLLRRRFWQACRAELDAAPARHPLRRAVDLRDSALQGPAEPS